MHLVIEAGCCVCWGRGRSFCLVLPLSTLPLGQCIVGAFPTPTLLLPCTPGLVGEAAGEDREQRQVEGVTHQPSGTPPPQQAS